MTNRKYKMYYDYKKRTNGGFLDAIFLSGIMVSGLILRNNPPRRVMILELP